MVRELVQAGRSTSCLGLTNGKMGIAIALFRYGRLSGELAYEEVASELLDDVCQNLTIQCRSPLMMDYAGSVGVLNI